MKFLDVCFVLMNSDYKDFTKKNVFWKKQRIVVEETYTFVVFFFCFLGLSFFFLSLYCLLIKKTKKNGVCGWEVQRDVS